MDARDFNNIKTRAVIKLFFPEKQGAEGNSRHSDRNISFFSFLVGLRTYQHPCTYRCLLKVLCPVRRSLTALDCVLLKENNRALVAGLRPEINL